MLTIADARIIPWCLEASDGVHRAHWTPDGGGWLTTLVDDIDNPAPPFHLLQRAATISELRDGVVKPWRDRTMFGAPICPICDADAALDDETTEACIEAGWFDESEAEHSEGDA